MKQIPNETVNFPSDNYAPFPSKSVFLLCYWHWMSSAQKTIEDLEKLRKLLIDPEFDFDSLRRLSLKRLFAKLASSKLEDFFSGLDGWISTSIGTRKAYACMSCPTPAD